MDFQELESTGPFAVRVIRIRSGNWVQDGSRPDKNGETKLGGAVVLGHRDHWLALVFVDPEDMREIQLDPLEEPDQIAFYEDLIAHQGLPWEDLRITNLCGQAMLCAAIRAQNEMETNQSNLDTLIEDLDH